MKTAIHIDQGPVGHRIRALALAALLLTGCALDILEEPPRGRTYTIDCRGPADSLVIDTANVYTAHRDCGSPKDPRPPGGP